MKKYLLQEELVIVLSKSEKKSFFSFLSLYIGSSFLLVIIIAYLYYNSISNSMLQNKKDKMKNYTMTVATNIIQAHMNNQSFNYTFNKEYKISLMSAEKKVLYGDTIKSIDFYKDSYIHNKNLYLVDKSSQMHLGVKYIVLKDENFIKKIDIFFKKVVTFTIIILFLIAFIGYFLSKLFLKPIANERKKLDDFIKNTTHELNTPITALLMSTNILESKENSPSTNRIKISANRISNIYSDLCYLLKNDLDINDKIVTVDLQEIISEQITLLSGYAKSKHITIIENLNILKFDIDTESAKRLTSNLISNALKYSKPNKNIEIAIINNNLIIKDYGVGIKEIDLKNIKKRYFRANKHEGGFGIGLDIVNNICQKYNIKFEINSIYNKGSTVSLTFNSIT